MERGRGFLNRALLAMGRRPPGSDYAHILAPADEELARAAVSDQQSHYQDESWEGDDEETVYGGENRDRQHAPVQLLKPTPKRRWKGLWVGVGVVAYFLLVWQIWGLVHWSEAPVLKVLTTMPVFSTSLGCLAELDAPFTHTETKSIPIGTDRSDLQFDIRGGAVGTLKLTRLESTFASGNPHEVTRNEVEMDLIMRSNNATLAKHFVLYEPPVNPDGSVDASHFVLFTPHADYIQPPPSNETNEPLGEDFVPQCMRFDVVLRIPSTLKKLHVSTYGPTHLLFDPSMEVPEWEDELQLEDMKITMFAFDKRNLLVMNDNGEKDGMGIRGKRMTLEAHGGWITGNISIMKRTEILARGAAVTNVRVQPLPASYYDSDAPEDDVAELLTVAGTGRADIIYEHQEHEPHRRIKSEHYAIDAGRETMDLRYRKAGLNGVVDVKAMQVQVKKIDSTAVSGALTKQGGKVVVGKKTGGDSIVINSPAGWVGLHV